MFKFLIVDDEPEIVEILKFLMEDLYPHSEIDTANDGLEGLTKANKKAYDLILTDFKMPKMNGDEFIKSIKQPNLPNADTGVLVITARGDLADIALNELSNTLVLDKPISEARLKSCTKILLALRA